MKSFFVFFFASAAAVAMAADPVNFAVGAKVTASSQENATFAPERAIDGKGNTRWSSERQDNQWLLIDLGEVRELGRIVLRWEAAAGKAYTVQLSENGENYVDVFTKTDGKSGAVEKITFPARKARFIRIECKTRTTHYGFSLWEVEAYAPVIGVEATASSQEKAGYSPAMAIDGNLKTRWSSAHKDNQWLQLDFTAPRTIGRVTLRWEAAAGKEYAIQLSKDGETWDDVFTKTDGKPNAVEEATFPPQEARYLRINCKTRATQHGFSLWEVETFEK